MTISNHWYYKLMGEEFGPVASGTLKSLAEDGTIERDTLVRKGEDGNWALAERVNGLFTVDETAPEIANTPQVVRPPVPTVPIDATATASRKLLGIIVAALLASVLLGVSFLWTKHAAEKAAVAREIEEKLEAQLKRDLEAITQQEAAINLERKLQIDKVERDRQEREDRQNKEIDLFERTFAAQMLALEDRQEEIRRKNRGLEREMSAARSRIEQLEIQQKIASNNTLSSKLKLEGVTATQGELGVLAIRQKYTAEEFIEAEAEVAAAQKHLDETDRLKESRQRLEQALAR